MRLSLYALPLALLDASPAWAAAAQPSEPADEAEVVRHSDGSFTIVAAIEPFAEALDALPAYLDQIDGRGDESRRPRDEADEALEEAFEEAEDIARTEAGPD